MPTCRGRRKAKGACAWLRVAAIQPLEQLNLQSDAVYLLTVPVVCTQDQAALFVEPPAEGCTSRWEHTWEETEISQTQETGVPQSPW